VDLFQKTNDVSEIAKNASTTLLFTTTSFRMINFYCNRTRYVNIVKYVDENLKIALKFGDKNMKRIIFEQMRYMKILTIVFWTFAIVTAQCMCIKSGFDAGIYHYKIANNFMVRNEKYCTRFNHDNISTESSFLKYKIIIFL
jgi:hypothetical protein